MRCGPTIGTSQHHIIAFIRPSLLRLLVPVICGHRKALRSGNDPAYFRCAQCNWLIQQPVFRASLTTLVPSTLRCSPHNHDGLPTDIRGTRWGDSLPTIASAVLCALTDRHPPRSRPHRSRAPTKPIQRAHKGRIHSIIVEHFVVVGIRQIWTIDEPTLTHPCQTHRTPHGGVRPPRGTLIAFSTSKMKGIAQHSVAKQQPLRSIFAACGRVRANEFTYYCHAAGVKPGKAAP